MPYDSLNSLLDVSGHPYGYRFDWVRRQTEALARASEGGPALTLTPDDVTNAMECAGLWEATPSAHLQSDRRQLVGQQLSLTHRVARRWMVAEAVAPVRPVSFVSSELGDHSWMTDTEVSWVARRSPEERTEIEHEMAAILSRVGQLVSFRDPHNPIRVGLEWPLVEIGNLVLASDDIDLCIGTHRVDGEGAWSSSVLVNFCLETPSETDLDRLGLSAVMHTISTGCPPARVIIYGLLDGTTDYRDVDADWLSLHFGFIMATQQVVRNSQNGETLTLTPGPHCARCPARRDCPFSRIGLEEF
jgi:hypothetical protein